MPEYRYFSGCSAARLARVVRDDEAEGSNPFTPTIFKEVTEIQYVAELIEVLCNIYATKNHL